MRVVGLDLAGSPRNQTGYCLLEADGEKTVRACVLHLDEEIIARVGEDGPELVAFDAPLRYDGSRRRCDEQLRGYGAIPVTLKGMEALARRGVALAGKLGSSGVKCVEVFSTASAKILGVYSRNDFTLQKNMASLDLGGDINAKILTRDELDAILAAVTGYLHLLGQTEAVGDEGGRVYVPKV